MRHAWLLLGCWACAEAPAPPIDLDGPRGRAVAPGPWVVRAFVDGATPRLFAAIDLGPFFELVSAPDGEGARVARLPDVPVGSAVRYYARVGDRTAPAGGSSAARSFVVTPVGPAPLPAPPADCTLAFRWPLDTLLLGPGDDAAPQAGTQVTVIVETNLRVGAAARLAANDVGYSGRAGSGVVAFSGVTLPEGPVALVVEATPEGGRPCAATINVRSAPP